MKPDRVLRFEIPSPEALQRLRTGPLPPGLEATEPTVEFFREVYYDAPPGELERRGAVVRLTIRATGERLLGVDVRERGQEDAPVLRAHAEAVVPDAPLEEVLAGATEPARLVRALIDPTRLSAQLELEVTRYRRRLRAAEGGGEVELCCDEVTVRRGEVATEFGDLEIRLPESGASGLEPAVHALEQELKLRATLAGRRERARIMLAERELRALEHALRSARQVAVVVQRNHEIALLRGEGELRVPVGSGRGEEACRRVLRACFGRSQGQLRRLGVSDGLGGTHPSIEVWLAQRVIGEADPAVEWVPLEQALNAAGSPALRDVGTLAALNLLARAHLPGDPAAAWSADDRARARNPFRIRLTPHPAAPEPQRPDAPDEDPRVTPELLINMDLSELAFHSRVLALAEDPDAPLLERVRFLSILGSNLDEFFMTRVAGFHQQVASGSTKQTQDGLSPQQQLDALAVHARLLVHRAYRFLWDELIPELETHGIRLLSWNELDPEDRTYLRDNYADQLGAVLTPLAADPSHPFPHIRNLRPALGVVIRAPESQARHFAAVELPGDLPRFVPLPGGRRFVPLEEVIAATLPGLYEGLEALAAHPFRVTRSANLSIDEEGVTDLLLAVEEEVQKRPLGPVVRLEVASDMPEEMRELLLRELQFEARERVATLRPADVYEVDGLVDLAALREIAALPMEELHYPPLSRHYPLDSDRPIWDVLDERSVLVRFPHDSFEGTVERLLAEAAVDPQVVAVKITLYRTSRSSEVVRLLRRARRNGKEVAALVELKASFDERRNIEWARSLESAGIHVVYGPAHLKVHAKVALVVRREGDRLRRYVYVGTGNLNAATAAGYTDLALLTTDPELGAELNDVFNALTGYSVRTDYQHLLVAPFNMKARFQELIRREAEHARAGRGGHIRVKMNGLTDRGVIAALYAASQAGVRVELVVRGICSLRPGVPGVSDNISVVSNLGRFLEHSRIYRFANAGRPEYFIGSADWRPRNLTRRVEVAAPVRDAAHRAQLDEILEGDLQNPDGWHLHPDGSYRRRDAPEHTPPRLPPRA